MIIAASILLVAVVALVLYLMIEKGIQTAKASVIIVIASLLAAGTILSGCAGASMYVNPDAPRCVEVRDHLIDIGCFEDKDCKTLVDDIVHDYIEKKLPPGIDFGTYCDIALKVDILPLDCVMEANTVPQVFLCSEAFKRKHGI